MTMWLPNLDSRKGPVYRAIADAIDEDVQSGAASGRARGCRRIAIWRITSVSR